MRLRSLRAVLTASAIGCASKGLGPYLSNESLRRFDSLKEGFDRMPTEFLDRIIKARNLEEWQSESPK